MRVPAKQNSYAQNIHRDSSYEESFLMLVRQNEITIRSIICLSSTNCFQFFKAKICFCVDAIILCQNGRKYFMFAEEQQNNNAQNFRTGRIPNYMNYEESFLM